MRRERIVWKGTTFGLGRIFIAFTILCSSFCLDLRAQQTVRGKGGLLDDLFLLRNTKTARISSYDRTGGNSDWVFIAPGETKTLAEISWTGVIRRFYFGTYGADRMRFRKFILRMYWDGEKEPCVEVPMGDFFGSGLGTLRYARSLVVNVHQGFSAWDFDAFVNYLPMPFAKGARITLENDGGVVGFRLWYHIDYEQYPAGALPPNAGRLHAQFRHGAHLPVREGNPKNTTGGNRNIKNTTGEDNFLILDAEGEGAYVGLFLTVDNTKGSWYGEGDDMIFVDGAKVPPTYNGTGHEEIFNAGCCPDVEYWGPYTGFYLIENYKADFGGKNQMYRFYVNDPVRFQKSIRVTVEHGHANNYENDYTSTAFWYQKNPHKAFPPMLKTADRLPGWPEGVAEALALETKLGLEVPGLTFGRAARISEADAKRLLELTRARNEAFHKFKYDDFIRDVKATEEIVARYRTAKPQ